MPVYKILDEMPYEELQGWIKYFKARPYGWREDQRTSMLLQVQGVKKKPQEMFPSLAELYQTTKPKIDPNFLRMLDKSTGGDKFEALEDYYNEQT